MEKVMELWSVPWIQSLLILSLSIVLSLLSRLVMKRVLLPLVQKTETELDDKILLYIKGPVSISFILLGLYYALKAHALPELNYLIGGILMTVAVAWWSVGLFRVSAVSLDHLSHQSEKTKSAFDFIFTFNLSDVCETENSFTRHGHYAIFYLQSSNRMIFVRIVTSTRQSYQISLTNLLMKTLSFIQFAWIASISKSLINL